MYYYYCQYTLPAKIFVELCTNVAYEIESNTLTNQSFFFVK